MYPNTPQAPAYLDNARKQKLSQIRDGFGAQTSGGDFSIFSSATPGLMAFMKTHTIDYVTFSLGIGRGAFATSIDRNLDTYGALGGGLPPTGSKFGASAMVGILMAAPNGGADRRSTVQGMLLGPSWSASACWGLCLGVSGNASGVALELGIGTPGINFSRTPGINFSQTVAGSLKPSGGALGDLIFNFLNPDWKWDDPAMHNVPPMSATVGATFDF
jgi:hypothetical protein